MVALQGEDEPEPVHVLGPEAPVAGAGPLGQHEAAVLQEAHLGRGDAGEFDFEGGYDLADANRPAGRAVGTASGRGRGSVTRMTAQPRAGPA